MKRSILRYKYALGLAAALLLASCSQDELTEQGTPLPVGQYPLELTAGGLQAVATPAQPATRGTFFEGNWDGVTKVKVAVNDFTRPLNYKVDASNDKKRVSLIPEGPLANDDRDFWWTSTEEQKNVAAWAPHKYYPKDEITLPKEWKEEHFAEYDIIGVRQTIGFENRMVPVKFQHLMAKVVVNLRETEYLRNAQKIEVKLLGIFEKGKLEIDNDRIQVINESENKIDITSYYLSPEIYEYEEVYFGNGQSEIPFTSYTALVVPQKIYKGNDDKVLQIEVDGTIYTVKRINVTVDMTTPIYYNAGKATAFNITVKENGLNVTVEESIGWGTDGASGSGEVELP